MSKYNQGILGSFSGKVGPVVGSYWKGKFVMRTRPYPKEWNPTAPQAENAQKFGAMGNFLKRFGGLLSVGFGDSVSGVAMTARNRAMKVNLEKAMSQNVSTRIWSVVPEQVQLTEGLYRPVIGLAVSIVAGTGAMSGRYNMNVTWANDAGRTIGYLADGTKIYLLDSDRVTLVAYNVDKDDFVEGGSALRRNDQSDQITMPEDWEEGDKVVFYNFTVSEVVSNYKAGQVMDDSQRKFAMAMIEQGYGVSSTGVKPIEIEFPS